MTVVTELENGMSIRMFPSYPDKIAIQLISKDNELISQTVEKASDMRRGMDIIIGQAENG